MRLGYLPSSLVLAPMFRHRSSLYAATRAWLRSAVPPHLFQYPGRTIRTLVWLNRPRPSSEVLAVRANCAIAREPGRRAKSMLKFNSTRDGLVFAAARRSARRRLSRRGRSRSGSRRRPQNSNDWRYSTRALRAEPCGHSPWREGSRVEARKALTGRELFLKPKLCTEENCRNEQ